MLQQGVRRFPINLRPLLGVGKSRSTKGMGFLARSFICLHQATGDPRWKNKAEFALQWLIENQSPGYSGACWGNHLHQESWREAGWLHRLRRDGMRRGVPRTIEGNVVGVGEGHLKVRVEDAIEDLAVDFVMVGIRPGDHVRVSFQELDGRRVAQRVEELARRQ